MTGLGSPLSSSHSLNSLLCALVSSWTLSLLCSSVSLPEDRERPIFEGFDPDYKALTVRPSGPSRGPSETRSPAALSEGCELQGIYRRVTRCAISPSRCPLDVKLIDASWRELSPAWAGLGRTVVGRRLLHCSCIARYTLDEVDRFVDSVYDTARRHAAERIGIASCWPILPLRRRLDLSVLNYNALVDPVVGMATTLDSLDIPVFSLYLPLDLVNWFTPLSPSKVYILRTFLPVKPPSFSSSDYSMTRFGSPCLLGLLPEKARLSRHRAARSRRVGGASPRSALANRGHWAEQLSSCR